MKTYNLELVDDEDGPLRYYVNGRKVSRQRYNEIRDAAHRDGTVDSFFTTRIGSEWHHHCAARTP